MIASLGTYCFRHRATTLVVWLLVLTAGVLSAGPVFEKMGDVGRSSPTEATRVSDILDEYREHGDSYLVLVTGDTDGLSAPIAEASADIAAQPGIAAVAPAVPAPDGGALLVTFTLAKDLTDSVADDAADDAIARFGEIADSSPGARVQVTGNALLNSDINGEVQKQLLTAEVISLPATLIVLAVVFGGLVAASVPVLAAVGTIIGSFVVMLVFSRFFDIDTTAMTIVTLLGLALSIDYGLLLVSRYREEIAAGATQEDAVRRTWSTAGRTVAFSGLTVAAALTGLLVIDQVSARSLAVAGIAAAVFAVITALTLPALLIRLFGHRITRSRRRSRTTADAHSRHGRFYQLARFGQRHPIAVIGGSVLALATIALPLLSMTTHSPDLDGVPRDLPSVAALHDVKEHYGRAAIDDPAIRVVAQASPAQLQSWADRWANDPRLLAMSSAQEVGGGYAMVAMDVADDQSEAAFDLVTELRDNRPAFDTWVGGSSASIHDFDQSILDGLPLALTVMAVTMFVLLWAMTGSVVIPLKALVMNVLSLGATMGAMVAVFQLGWLSGPLATITLPGMLPFTLLMVFVFGFGLSMDYEVFLLSRIKENVDAGMPTDDAVAHGIQHTGRIITCAALLMMICFSGFAAAGVSQIEQIGLGLLIAVLIDATIVRCLLVPATMSVLGRWNWWSPFTRRSREQTPVEPVEHGAPGSSSRRERSSACVHPRQGAGRGRSSLPRPQGLLAAEGVFSSSMPRTDSVA